MSHVGNILNMLLILQSSKQIVKIKDLAERLEIDPSSIRRYRDNLIEAAIPIESVRGKHGGYYLNDTSYKCLSSLTKEEYQSMLMLEKELIDSKHISSKDFSQIILKLDNIFKDASSDYSNYLAKSAISNVDFGEERNKLIDLRKAILSKRKFKMTYFSLSSGEKTRIVHPYAVFQYKGDMYFVAFCENKNELRDFKFCRIRQYELLKDIFEEDKSFDLNEYFNKCFGIHKDKEIYIKLHIKYPMSQIISEKIWVENQEISFQSDKSIIFKAIMQGKNEIVTWILSMGSNARVLEPESIKNKIEDEIKKMQKIYE